MNLVKKNAAMMVPDNEAINKMVPGILSLLKDEARQHALKSNIGLYAVGDADEVIAKEILKSIG
jgi:UDP-N-acetylglucosamine:LPS N-acetylglucosamine transferase